MYISSSPPIRSYSAGYLSTRLRLFRYFHLDISTSTSETVNTQKRKFVLKPWGKGRPTTRSIHRRERVSASRSDLHHCINIHDIKRHRSPVVLHKVAHMHERPTHDLRMVAATSTQRSEICRATTCESWIMYLSPYPYLKWLLLTSSSAQILVVGGRSTRQSQR
jgi:hypothetical protein